MKVKILCEKKIGLQALTQVHSYHTNFPPEIPLFLGPWTPHSGLADLLKGALQETILRDFPSILFCVAVVPVVPCPDTQLGSLPLKGCGMFTESRCISFPICFPFPYLSALL